MAFISSIPAIASSIGASALFSSAPVQGLLTTLGLAGATVGAQVLALGLISTLTLGALGTILYFYSQHQATTHKTANLKPKIKPKSASKPIVPKPTVSIPIEKHKMTRQHAYDVEQLVKAGVAPARLKQFAQRFNYADIELTTDINQLRPNEEGITTLFFDWHEATAAQKEAYQDYRNTYFKQHGIELNSPPPPSAETILDSGAALDYSDFLRAQNQGETRKYPDWLVATTKDESKREIAIDYLAYLEAPDSTTIPFSRWTQNQAKTSALSSYTKKT